MVAGCRARSGSRCGGAFLICAWDVRVGTKCLTTRNIQSGSQIVKKHEINLKFTETNTTSLSESCKCEFCGDRIHFYLHKRWNTNIYRVQSANGEFHGCSRPTSWSEFGSGDIPIGWEYSYSDDDDDRACFTRKKYTQFEK